MRTASLFTAGLLALSNVVATPSPTKVQQRSAHNRRTNNTPGFVYAEDGKFKIDGKDFFFAGTTAYWLTQVQGNDDITKTLDDIKADDLEVVRIWGFREVIGQTNDDPATFTQQWINGEQKCNQPGIDRIKFILDEAGKRGIYVQISLTNNWAPTFPANATTKFPPGYLSNSYGGIDTYVQQIHPGGDRDLFYTDDTVKDAYKKWLNCIIPQIASHKALFAWELANDPRCKGADGTTTSGSCNAQTVTRWTADTSKFVKTLDPNHMAASGDGGFYCTDCKKLFPPPPPPPSVSGGSRNMVGKRAKQRTGYLTAAMVREQIKAREKAAYRAARNAPGAKKSIRGGWAAPATSFKRQADSSIGPGYDGSYQVDTEDIANIPTIDYQSFQFFPDQNTYHANGEVTAGPPPGGAGGENFENTVQAGLDWITNHAHTAQAFNKPTHMSAMGLVSADNSGSFVPFFSTNVADTDTDGPVKMKKRAQRVSSDSQQRRAYGSWANHAVSSGISGITNYQRGQSNLKGRDSSKRSIEERQQGSRNSGSDSQGSSPDDGYRILKEGTKSIFKNTGKAQKRKSGRDSD